MTIADIIAKLEAATEGSRELDCEVWVAANGKGQPMRVIGTPSYDPPRYLCNPNPEIDWGGYDLLNIAPHYTTSLDAALTLALGLNEQTWLTIRVPIGGAPADEYPGNPISESLAGKSGAFLDLGRSPYTAGCWAPTPALALCIAALRARSAP